MPGVRSEPHMTGVADYLASVRFQLASYKGRFGEHEFIQTWDDIAETVRDSYDRILRQGGGAKRLALDLLPESTDDVQKARALYHHVQSAIQTAPRQWVLSRDLRMPNEVIKDGRGSAIEKNLLLTNLLRHAGLRAHPCLISTRSNGRLDERQPTIQQFNSVLVCVDVGADTLLLDTQDAHYPFGLLPVVIFLSKSCHLTPHPILHYHHNENEVQQHNFRNYQKFHLLLFGNTIHCQCWHHHLLNKSGHNVY